jgi:hypothetical protein
MSLLGIADPVERGPVNCRYVRHVLRALEPAFDLKCGNSGLNEAGKHFQACQVPGAEEITAIA